MKGNAANTSKGYAGVKVCRVPFLGGRLCIKVSDKASYSVMRDAPSRSFSPALEKPLAVDIIM
jgi:hypothetical protein